jgi:hypothetical protein
MECNDQGNEKYKIGITKKNPEERLKKLNTGNPNNLTLIKTYSSHNYRRIETWLHKKYETQKTLAQNEFFTLSNEQVISFIDDCKYIDQVINYMLQNNHFYN